ncbi:DUF3784 domain-containing protein [Dyadobacter diqingensis]|uniref:DUF3784 domain-containing protein n=1 Tax=Dyadobacter diqingensis TaxID=2938121 RepID=UPI0020C1A062|nr:DUF3784 domain-containing protein [Dyadobacter diqingensis]
MLIPTLLISGVFGLIAFTVTKKNARYLLSGYNTMSESQRAMVDIDGYLHFFKRFHLILSSSLLLLVLLTGLISKNLAGIIMGTYPLLAYGYFIVKSRKYFSKVRNEKKSTVIALAILGATVLFVGALSYAGFKNSQIVFDKNSLEITGMYGKKFERAKILDVKLVNSLPEITMKSDGFAAGDFSKGYFRTKDRKTVRLFVNKQETPMLLLNTTEGEIYFSSSEKSSEDLLREIQKWRGLL